MTPEQIKALPDRELDTLIAEKIYGLKIYSREWPCGYMEGHYYAATENPTDFPSIHSELGPVTLLYDGPDEPFIVEPVEFYSTAPAISKKLRYHLSRLGWCWEICSVLTVIRARFWRLPEDSKMDIWVNAAAEERAVAEGALLTTIIEIWNRNK